MTTVAQSFSMQHTIQTQVLLVESPKLYPWTTALYIARNNVLAVTNE